MRSPVLAAVLGSILAVGVFAACGGSSGGISRGPATDKIVTYESKPLSDYAKLAWSFPGGTIPAAGLPTWLYARVSALVATPGVVPPMDPPVPFSYSGLGSAQRVRATFNLTTGTGTATLRALNGRCVVRLTGAAGAFEVVQTSTLAPLTSIFTPAELADTPYVIMNLDPSLVTVDEWTVDGADYSGAMGGVGASFGVFFPSDPNLPLADNDWKEKWCWIINDTDEELQEY